MIHLCFLALSYMSRLLYSPQMMRTDGHELRGHQVPHVMLLGFVKRSATLRCPGADAHNWNKEGVKKEKPKNMEGLTK